MSYLAQMMVQALRTKESDVSASVLPRRTLGDVLEVTRIDSAADQLPADVLLIRGHPFRASQPSTRPMWLVDG